MRKRLPSEFFSCFCFHYGNPHRFFTVVRKYIFKGHSRLFGNFVKTGVLPIGDVFLIAFRQRDVIEQWLSQGAVRDENTLGTPQQPNFASSDNRLSLVVWGRHRVLYVCGEKFPEIRYRHAITQKRAEI